MKKTFGLPLPERRVAPAHDFVQLACSPNVLLTRARRVGKSPTVPSRRFLLQIETVPHAAGHRSGDEGLILQASLPWPHWAKLLDKPDGSVCEMQRPEPCPPLAARPKKLSVTEISTWLHNPYAIYAKRVLGLYKLEDIDADVAASDCGSAVHEALEKPVVATKDQTGLLDEEAEVARLLALGRKAFAVFADRPQVMTFWWPRFQKSRVGSWRKKLKDVGQARGPFLSKVGGALSMRGGAFTPYRTR